MTLIGVGTIRIPNYQISTKSIVPFPTRWKSGTNTPDSRSLGPMLTRNDQKSWPWWVLVPFYYQNVNLDLTACYYCSLKWLKMSQNWKILAKKVFFFLLVPVGTCGYLLVPVGTCWYLLASVGTTKWKSGTNTSDSRSFGLILSRTDKISWPW